MSSNQTDGFLLGGTELVVVDSFRTENSFDGIEFGVTSQWQKQSWVFGATSRFGFGNVQQRAIISGSTTTTVPGAAASEQPFGLLAAPSNIGTFERDEFGILSDMRLELGYWLGPNLKFQLGYNLLFLSDVARPGDLVSTTLDPTQIDPLATSNANTVPAFAWQDNYLLLHGFSVGAEVRF